MIRILISVSGKSQVIQKRKKTLQIGAQGLSFSTVKRLNFTFNKTNNTIRLGRKQTTEQKLLPYKSVSYHITLACLKFFKNAQEC